MFTKKNESREKRVIDSDSLFIDVRTPFEYRMGHIESSINIPLGEIADHIPDFRRAGKKIVLVCRSGARSGQAAELLKSNSIDAVNGGPWTDYSK